MSEGGQWTADESSVRLCCCILLSLLPCHLFFSLSGMCAVWSLRQASLLSRYRCDLCRVAELVRRDAGRRSDGESPKRDTGAVRRAVQLKLVPRRIDHSVVGETNMQLHARRSAMQCGHTRDHASSGGKTCNRASHFFSVWRRGGLCCCPLQNKRDAFADKLEHAPLARYFPSYQPAGGVRADYQSAVDFLKHEFEAKNQQPYRRIYTHVTATIDEANMRAVLSAVSRARGGSGWARCCLEWRGCLVVCLWSHSRVASRWRVMACQLNDVVVRRHFRGGLI